jgi:hypothetical protein
MNGSRCKTELEVILITFLQFGVKSGHNYSRMPAREAKRTPSRRHRRVRLGNYLGGTVSAAFSLGAHSAPNEQSESYNDRGGSKI